MRGYAAIGLHRPKNRLNVGEALRAAGCYGASLVAASGLRYRHAPTDTQAAYRHLPLVVCEDLSTVRPWGSTCVAVDYVPDARVLADFTHPESAFYVFGPEDGTLGGDVLGWCSERVYVPTKFCMNLAATVNVVLYDRSVKRNDWR